MTRFGWLVLALLVIQAVPARAYQYPPPVVPPLPPPVIPPLPPPGPGPVPNPPVSPVDFGPIAPPVPEGLKPSPVLTLPPPPTPPAPQPQEPPRTQVDPVTGLPARVPRNPPPPPPPRTGPFRSCGSGAGTGLAGIGAAWALMWLGNRFAGRAARRTKNTIG